MRLKLKDKIYISKCWYIKIQTLREAGKTNVEVSNFLGVSSYQVRYTIKLGCITPEKSTGQPPKLTSEQEDELEIFVCISN